jgi:hypothetical protein
MARGVELAAPSIGNSNRLLAWLRGMEHLRREIRVA